MLALSIAATAAAVVWAYLVVGHGGDWGGRHGPQRGGARAAAVVWASLVVGHGGYWRASQWLPPVAAEPDRWPDVVAVVPARNEAEMLPVTLPALLGQDYPGALSVIVVDDASSDGTAEVATSLGRGFARALRVVPGTAPPDAAEPPGGL